MDQYLIKKGGIVRGQHSSRSTHSILSERGSPKKFVTYSLKSINEFVPCQRINAFAFNFTFYTNGDVFMYKPVL